MHSALPRAATVGVTLVVALLWPTGSPVAASAQSVSETPRWSLAGPAFFAVLVDDIERASQWYAEAFGLEQVREFGGEGERFTIRLLSSKRQSGADSLSGHALTVELVRMDAASAVEGRVLGLFKTGLHVEQIDAAHAWFAARSEGTDERVFTDGALRARSFVVRDPFGNRIQFFEACGEACPE